jgi:hypothetical protein
MPGLAQNAFQHSPIAALFLGRTFDAAFGSGPLNGTDTTPSDTVRHSRANWIDASATVTISERERLENQGGNRIVPIIQAEMENATLSLVDIVADSLYDQSTLGPTGLEQMATAGGAAVQGLDGDTYANWNSRGVSARGTAAASVSFASGSFSAQGVADMRTSYNNASEGALKPQIGLTTYSVLEFYEGQIVPQERYTSPQMGNLSFMNLAFKDAVVVGDPKCTSGTLYWVNPASTFAVALTGANFTNGEAHRAEKQEATNMQLMWKGQLVSKDRRLVNKINSITA